MWHRGCDDAAWLGWWLRAVGSEASLMFCLDAIVEDCVRQKQWQQMVMQGQCEDSAYAVMQGSLALCSQMSPPQASTI